MNAKFLGIGSTDTTLEYINKLSSFLLLADIILGSLGIAPTWDCTHFLKIGFVVARGRFIHIIFTNEINQIKKENCKKKIKFYAY